MFLSIKSVGYDLVKGKINALRKQKCYFGTVS